LLEIFVAQKEKVVQKEREPLYQAAFTEGLAEGTAENRHETVKAMLISGQVKLHFISKVTGLSEDNIKAIQRK